MIGVTPPSHDATLHVIEGGPIAELLHAGCARRARRRRLRIWHSWSYLHSSAEGFLVAFMLPDAHPAPPRLILWRIGRALLHHASWRRKIAHRFNPISAAEGSLWLYPL